MGGMIGDLLTGGTSFTHDDVQVVTKLWPTNLGFDRTLGSVRESLRKLRSNYIDMYLLHWPRCYDNWSWMDCSSWDGGTWQQSYKAMEKLYAEGVLVSIGVSNFNENELGELMRTM